MVPATVDVYYLPFTTQRVFNAGHANMIESPLQTTDPFVSQEARSMEKKDC